MTIRIDLVRFCFASLLATSVLGQTAESPPAFEVASVKLNTGGAPYYNDSSTQMDMRGTTLGILISRAYQAKSWSLSGPDWLNSVKLDVIAKLPASMAGLSFADRYRLSNVMLQGLLAERFKLKVHHEEKVVPGYDLVVANGGPKLRHAVTDQARGEVMLGSITTHSAPIFQIVTAVAGTLRSPVHDMTGLSGNYEFTLKWTPDDTAPVGADNTSTTPGDRPPSIFTALQEQLGLKLEPRKFPTDVVVVDHVERIPTGN
jgi:uncharacterized protein (TIGR03435 family)